MKSIIFLLSRYRLQILLEAMFTIGNQFIANEKFRKPVNYKDVLTVLFENKIIDEHTYVNLIPFAELRNKLVHTYWKISVDELKIIAQKDLLFFSNFVNAILSKM